MKNSTAKTDIAPEAQDEQVKPIANIGGVYAYEATELEWHTSSNPKRPSGKAHARFEKYMKAKTVGEYIAAGGTKADLKYDSEKEYVSLVS